MSEEPNYSEIVIYNLSAETENAMLKTGKRVVLEAGYENSPQYGVIFDGDAVQVLRGKEEGTTNTLTLVSQDGDLFLNGGFVSATYSAGQTPMTIAAQVTGKAAYPAQMASVSDNLNNQRLTRGKVCFGLARDYLRQIAVTEQAAFYVDDGKVNIVKAADLPKGQVVDLNPHSGLVGAAEQTEGGVKAKCLLNPLLSLNSFVHIDGAWVREAKAARDSQPRQIDADGVYRIISIKHTGDTCGGEWYTDIEGIAQAGSAPETGESMR